MTAKMPTGIAGGSVAGDVDVPRRVGWHPGIDEFAEAFVVYATASRLVLLTEAFASFVAEAAARGVRPVLVTAPDARVSAYVSLAMRAAGGVWAVQDAEGATFDALTGYRIAVWEELWTHSDVSRERLLGYTTVSEDSWPVVTFDVYSHQSVAERTQVGGIASALVQVAGHRLESFGTREPLMAKWDLHALTEAARAVMPESQTLRVAGSGGVFGQIQVARTPTGLLEHTVLGLPMPRRSTGGEVIEQATVGLERIAERLGVTVGCAALMRYDSAGDGDALVAVQGAVACPPEAPVAVLVGPRGVRDLAVDFDELSAIHDVRRLGRVKVPSLLVRFTGRDRSLWGQVAQFAAALGPQSIARAVGLPVTS